MARLSKTELRRGRKGVPGLLRAPPPTPPGESIGKAEEGLLFGKVSRSEESRSAKPKPK